MAVQTKDNTMSNTFNNLVFYLNGRKVQECEIDPSMTVATYLREVTFLTGTKVSCGEGGCGACTVMLSRLDPLSKHVSHLCVYACLLPICYIHGMAVTTIEGLGSVQTRLHPIQDYLVRCHGIQCGFCTPGMVMTMYTLLRNNPKPSQEDIERALDGVICRCTGYRPILEGFENLCSKGDDCCRSVGNRTCLQEDKTTDSSDDMNECTQEFIFPPELLNNTTYHSESVIFTAGQSQWMRPTSLQQLTDWKKDYPMAKLVAGYNDIGLENIERSSSYKTMICLSHVPELNQLSITEEGLTIGAAVSFSQVIDAVRSATIQDEKKRIFDELASTIGGLGGVHTLNTSTFGGHIVTASVNSDLIPLLMVSRCKVNMICPDGVVSSIEFEKFIKVQSVEPLTTTGNVILSIQIPLSCKNTYIQSYRTNTPHRRKTTDSVLSAGMYVKLDPVSKTIQEMKLCFGGMTEIVMLENETIERRGRRWDVSLYRDSIKEFDQYCKETKPPNAEYKLSMMESFFFKFYNMVCKEADIQNGLPNIGQLMIPKRKATSYQTWQDHVQGTVGKPLHHASAKQQSTGEAVFIDDIPPRRDELFLTLVISTRAHAKIVSIDTSRALALEGVVCFVGADDVPDMGECISPMDDEIFATTEVTCVGQIIGGIVATRREISRKASQLVQVNYEDMKQIITIEDAIDEGSFFVPKIELKYGNTEEGLAESEGITNGEVRIGGQEHFYMETQQCIVIPNDGAGTFEILSSTQDPSFVQFMVASRLGIPSHKVIVKATRIGGGFGGKESRCLIPSLACAVAAYRTKRPVRCVLERQDDMRMTGGRHPVLAKYKVGFSLDGRIKALDVDMYMNGGNTNDYSVAVIATAVTNLYHCYDIPALHIQGHVCKTNLPSNTAFRGFGTPQAYLIMETIMSKIAVQTGVAVHEVRLKNFMVEDGNKPIDHNVEPNKLRICWETCKQKSDFENRSRRVAEFNSSTRWTKRGLGIIPTRFPIGLALKKLNQASALVNVYLDGSVSVIHGGIEMGQGLHTKITQIASTVLDIPMERVFITNTTTQVVPNQPPTHASVSTDYNGMAVKIACEKIKKRLQPFVDENPMGSWKEWVTTAHENLVSLSATGHYGVEQISYDPVTGKGPATLYCTHGAACSEVEIDCLTGEHQVLRTDIVMDVGRSINPALDIGQIEGAFLQGYGLFVTEELRWSENGELLNCGPGMYNVPRVKHIPREFNVHLLPNSDNPKAVFSSRGIGEPPLFLSSSVFFAIKEAIQAARLEIGLKDDFDLFPPATQENIRKMCGDQVQQYKN